MGRNGQPRKNSGSARGEDKTAGILQVSTADIHGGAERVAHQLHEALLSRGYDSNMAVGYKRGQDPRVFLVPNRRKYDLWARSFDIGSYVLSRGLPAAAPLKTACDVIGHPDEAYSAWRGREHFGYSGTRRILDLPRQRPSMVHCHNLHGGYFDLRALPWLCRQVRVGLTLHDSWLLTGHCAGPGECERWRMGCGNCPDLTLPRPIRRDASAYNWRRKRDILAGCSLSVVTPSRHLMSRVRESHISQAAVSYHVIPNGVDLGRFRPGAQSEARRSLGLPEKARVVLLIAHNPFKDYETMAAALKRIRPQEGVPLLFVCLGKTARDKAVGQGRMIYPGFVLDESKVIRYYQASDVYVHAANDESFGKTISEAMACQVPVVATEVGGIPEQMIDEHTGFLVARKDVEAMARRTQLLLDREDLRLQIGENALQHVQENFEIGKMIRAYMSWYEETLGGISNPSPRHPRTGDTGSVVHG